jgi:hypothetical protein
MLSRLNEPARVSLRPGVVQPFETADVMYETFLMNLKQMNRMDFAVFGLTLDRKPYTKSPGFQDDFSFNNFSSSAYTYAVEYRIFDGMHLHIDCC